MLAMPINILYKLYFGNIKLVPHLGSTRLEESYLLGTQLELSYCKITITVNIKSLTIIWESLQYID